jgi:hypothetical protein
VQTLLVRGRDSDVGEEIRAQLQGLPHCIVGTKPDRVRRAVAARSLAPCDFEIVRSTCRRMRGRALTLRRRTARPRAGWRRRRRRAGSCGGFWTWWWSGTGRPWTTARCGRRACSARACSTAGRATARATALRTPYCVGGRGTRLTRGTGRTPSRGCHPCSGCRLP